MGARFPLGECGFDLFQVVFVVRRDFVEFRSECSDSCFAVDEFQMSVFLIMHARLVNHSCTNGFVDSTGETERRLRIIEPFCPRILIECPQNLFWLADDAPDSVV